MKKITTEIAKKESESFLTKSSYVFSEKYNVIIERKVCHQLGTSSFFEKGSSEKGILSSISEKFSLNFLTRNKLKQSEFFKPDSNVKKSKPIVINDPEIDLDYISSLFSNPDSVRILLSNISSENLSQSAQILNQFNKDLVQMYFALNSDKIDVDFIKERFRKYYSYNEEYNGELRGQKLRYDHLLFRQAFLKNPEKFQEIEDFIPVNLGFSINLAHPERGKPIICHSIGGKVTENSLIHSHELVVARVANSFFDDLKSLFVSFDQKDDEALSLLEKFTPLNSSPQNIPDFSILDEDTFTRTDWDVKQSYVYKLKLNDAFNKARYCVYGNFSSSRSELEYMLIYQNKVRLRLLDKLNKERKNLTSEEYKKLSEVYDKFFFLFKNNNTDPAVLIRLSQDYSLNYRRVININFFNEN